MAWGWKEKKRKEEEEEEEEKERFPNTNCTRNSALNKYIAKMVTLYLQ